MVRRLFSLAAVTVMLAALWPAVSSPARAGAWPREKGTGFFTGSSRIAGPSLGGPIAVYSASYLEYGLGRDLTLGLDLGHGVSGRSKAIMFLRYPIRMPGNGHHVAIELGVGTIAGEPALRPGLSYGRGFSTRRGGSGWMAADGFAEYTPRSGRVDLKADLTLGFNHGTRFKSIFQVQTGLSRGDPSFVRLAPSMVMRMGRNTHIELGVTAGLVGDRELGFKLGFWRDF
jgi:hypothetical protein